MIKVYQIYIFKKYLKNVLSISGIFFSLILILNVFEEINYFKDIEITLFFPLLLNFLNAPSILYGIFPFIFLISSQFFFVQLIESNELIIFKNIGLDNFKLIKILSFLSFLLGIFIIIFFYNISSKFKYFYLDLKNDYASDNKYLAVITENGLWIRDEVDNRINIVNADTIDGNYLKNVMITQYDYDFKVIRHIYSENVDIEKNNWFIKRSKISKTGSMNINKNNFYFKSNFNSEKINKLFSNLESLTLWELYKLRKDYKEVGYSVADIELHLQKIYSFPLYLVIMTALSAVIMLNIKFNKPKAFYLLLGIALSVIIFYINHFASVLGENNKLPIKLSVWLPLIFMSILTTVGLVKINEK
jgi:lipopolysaccharide export system permease protein